VTLAEWVLAAVMALPISKHDRGVDPALKRSQLETVSYAIADVAQSTKWPGTPRELAALLIIEGKHESAFALHVHAGNCLPGECDHGRARGPWQQQAGSTSSPAAWLLLGGLDEYSTRFAAQEAARALARSRWMCRSLERGGNDWVEMTMSAYAGHGCKGWFPGLKTRVFSYSKVMAL
jgi:hypothetical protein